jgi:glycosyltransferase involved in cell wall biosynthesis
MTESRDFLCDIIIPVWNQMELTRRCVNSIRAKTQTAYRLILIDNGSAGEAQRYLENLAKDTSGEVILIRNQENIGYVRAINQGLSRSEAPYVCLMNNDIEVTERWLERMIGFAAAHPEAGLINCQQNHDPSRAYPQDLEAFARTQVLDTGSWMELDHCTGGCLLIKREVLDKIGNLDEAFGRGHWEDNDFARRAQEAGYRSIRLMDTYVWHDVSSSFKQIDRWQEEAQRNEDRFYRKWGRPLRILYPLHERIDLRRARFQQIFQTVHALARGGCKVHLVVGRKEPSIHSEILPHLGLWDHENLRVHEVPMLRMGPDRRLRLSWDGVFHWFCFLKIRKLLHKGEIDAIFTRHLNSAAFFASLKKILGAPLFFEAHEIFFLTTERPEKKERIRRQEAHAYRGMDGIVANTGAVAKALRDLFRIKVPIVSIPNGVNLRNFKRERKTPNPRKIVYVGQLYPWKGVGTLILAMTHVVSGELHVVGGGGEQIEKLKREVERIGIKDRVHFHGQVPANRVADHLADAAVAVHPLTGKYRDGEFTSPLKVFEYLAAGVPIVAADLPSTREILADGVNALLVPPDDPAELARAIQKILEDPQLAERLARKGQEDAVSFSWERRAERLLAFFGTGKPKRVRDRRI